MKERTRRHQDWRARQHELGTVPHGTDNGYAGYGCRCDDCRTAHRDARRVERAAKQAERVTPR